MGTNWTEPQQGQQRHQQPCRNRSIEQLLCASRKGIGNIIVGESASRDNDQRIAQPKRHSRDRQDDWSMLTQVVEHSLRAGACRLQRPIDFAGCGADPPYRQVARSSHVRSDGCPSFDHLRLRVLPRGAALVREPGSATGGRAPP